MGVAHRRFLGLLALAGGLVAGVFEVGDALVGCGELAFEADDAVAAVSGMFWSSSSRTRIASARSARL